MQAQCYVCFNRGMTHGCPFCNRKKAKPRSTNRELIIKERDEEHEKYLQETWQKMQDFNMTTCGVPSIDDQCRERFGGWL